MKKLAQFAHSPEELRAYLIGYEDCLEMISSTGCQLREIVEDVREVAERDLGAATRRFQTIIKEQEAAARKAAGKGGKRR